MWQDEVLQPDRRTPASATERAPILEKQEIGDSRADWEVLDTEKLKKQLVEEAELDVFYSPSSEPLDEGLEDIKEVDEGAANMEGEDNVVEEESDVPEVST